MLPPRLLRTPALALAFVSGEALGGEVLASDDATDPVSDAEGVQWPIEFPGQCEPSDPNFDLELMYYEQKFKDGLSLTEQRLAASSPTADLYWMKARFMYEIGEGFEQGDRSVDRVAWYQEMLDTVEKGLALVPDDPHLRFARGVAMGRLGTTRGVLSSLFMAKDVERDWLTVAKHPTWRYASLEGREMLPCDAYHALGIYYRLVPDWWIVQMIAGTRGDLDRSLDWNQKSTQCKPKEVENWKELGATQLCIGQKRNDPAMVEAGVASLRRGAALPTYSERNRIDQKHCLAMIEDHALACGYSRDGQQDLDQKKLEGQGNR